MSRFDPSRDIQAWMYILDENGHPIPISDTLEWARWYETCDRHVAVTQIAKDIRVSTVFLGIDHNFSPMIDPLLYRPVLWETMVFGGTMDSYQQRYTSLEEAKKAHELIVAQARAEYERIINMSMEQRAALRPQDYASLSPEEQWEIDKRLHILDWEEKHDVEVAGTTARLHFFARGRRFRNDDE